MEMWGKKKREKSKSKKQPETQTLHQPNDIAVRFCVSLVMQENNLSSGAYLMLRSLLGRLVQNAPGSC